MAISNVNSLSIPKFQMGIQVTKVTDSSSDWASVANSTYFYDKADGLVHYKNSSGTVLEIFSSSGGGSGVIDVGAGLGSTYRISNCNSTADPYSTVSGGQCNTTSTYNASCGWNTISGGFSNTISGYYGGVTIGGGCCNSSLSTGGANNSYSTISGGYCNCTCAYIAVIGGGSCNYIPNSGNSSTISGGYRNTATCCYSTVGGGLSNNATGYVSTIGGGCRNIASNQYSTISGGYSNTASCRYTTVSGGYCNSTTGYASTIGGGYNNSATGGYSAVLGGELNNARCNYSGIYGCNITAVAANTFHVNCLALMNIPTTNPGITGLVWSDSCVLKIV